MEAVGQLTGGVAHDFNNLLTVVLGNLELLEERLTDAADRLARRATRSDAAERGAELTERLLAFARRQPLQPRPLDSRPDRGDMPPCSAAPWARRSRSSTEAPDACRRCMADASQLQNALLNLAHQCARRHAERRHPDASSDGERRARPSTYATHADGLRRAAMSLLVGHRHRHRHAGRGAASGPSSRSSPPRRRAPAAGSASPWSTASSKQSGGETRIYSEPGHGTTVRLYLPQAEQALAATAKLPSGLPDAFPGRGETILVTEDEALVRRYVVKRLIGLGYRVLEAENGPMAFRILEQEGPVDLLFTDIVMPGGMTGIDLAQLVWQRWPGMRVVFTSAYAEPELHQRGRPDGSLWLRKPYSALDLARILRQALDTAPSDDALPNPSSAELGV